MENKNVLFWVGVKSKDPHLRNKHGDFKYLDISKKCWELWCEKNDIVFFEYNTPSESDTSAHKVTWQRWFDVFPLIETMTAGGPFFSSEVMEVYIFRTAFVTDSGTMPRLGYACAAGVFWGVAVLFITVLQGLWMRRTRRI